MKLLSFGPPLLCVVLVWVLGCFLDPSRAQEPAGPAALRRGLTWQHNGQVFSLLSRGSQYRPNLRGPAGGPRSGDPVLLLSSTNDTAARGAPRVPAASGTAQLRTVTRQQPRAMTEGPETRRDGDPVPVARDDMMVGDDPYNPYKQPRYDPYYNYFDTYYRPRARSPARPGYGTRYHQNGTSVFIFIFLMTR